MFKPIITTFGILVYLPVLCQLQDFSDEFNRKCSFYDWLDVNLVEGWNASHLEVVDVHSTNPDQLTLMPYTTAWYADYRSNLLYKEVSGDFIFSIDVTAYNRAEDGNLPSSQYSLAGAMIRTPTGITSPSQWTNDLENYVFLSVGTSLGTIPQFERKTTTNGNSILNLIPIDTTSAVIKLVKKSPAIIVLYRLPGGSFQVLHRYSRPDMPDTLQVGVVAYTDWQKVQTYSPLFHNSNVLNTSLNPDPSSNSNQAFNPDITAKFQYARFEPLVLDSIYLNLDFIDPQQISNATLLSLFGFETPSIDVQGWNIWQGIDNNWANVQNWSKGTIPTVTDSVLVPNCSCVEVVFPTIEGGQTVEVASLIIEENGQIDIMSGNELVINLSGSSARFINYGTINCSGEISTTYSLGRTTINQGVINCLSGGNCNIFYGN